jgi:hypothetical protein
VLYDPRSGSNLRHCRHAPTACHGYSRQAYCTSFTLAEWLCRAADRIDPARVFGPHHCLGQGTSASDSERLCGLLQRRENASVIEQGCACLSPGSAIRRHKFARHTGRTSSSIRSDLDFRYTQDLRWRAKVPARQIRMTSQEVSADVRLCLTVTCLYTMVGLGLVVAFM